MLRECRGWDESLFYKRRQLAKMGQDAIKWDKIGYDGIVWDTIRRERMGWDGTRNFAMCNLQYFDFLAPSIWTFEDASCIIHYDLCRNSLNEE